MATQLPIKDKSDKRRTLKIAPFKSAIRQTEPHRHNGYFELIYLTAGTGIHVIDDRKYAVEPPVLFVIRRDQVHYWDLTTPGEGYVLIIRKEFVDALEDGRLRSLFASISTHSCMHIEANPTIEKLWPVLMDELETDKDPIPEVAQSVLKALLGKIVELANPASKSQKEKGGLYEQFLHLLEGQKTLKRTVAHYAALLHATPQNLNNACRKAVNRSATEVLGDYILSEARRLLLYTSGTVSEISFTLDFKDPSHFGKYFKRITGQTPQKFRHA
jgi:AraC family transcriptional activator of pobA